MSSTEHPMEYLRRAAGDELLARWPKAEKLNDGQMLSALCWATDEENKVVEDEIILELLAHIAAITEENTALKKQLLGG